jgi:chemotaxis protein methyltransferase CheR
VLDSRIRQRVHIEPLNLALDTYPSFANGTWRMDLILCRNVLMYFDHAGVRAVARRLWECLAHTGWLVTGPSDPSINEDGLYESVTTPAGVFYRRGRVAIPDAGAVVSSAGPSELEPQSTRALLELPTGALAAEVSAPSPMRPDVLADAKAAFERGDYGRAGDLARGLPEACAAALRVRALANARGPSEAERAASDAALRYPLAPEIHLLRGVVLMDMDRYEGAAKAAKRALYLDRTLAFGHFLLGLAVARLGDTEGARRALRNAGELCARQGPDEIVAFSDGQRAGRFAEAVTTQLELLGGKKS